MSGAVWPCIGRGVALQTGDWSRAPDMCPPPPPPRPSSAELSIAQQQQTELCRYLQEISVSGRLHQSGNQLGTCGAWPGAFVPLIRRTERDIESGISEKPVICNPKSQPIIIYLSTDVASNIPISKNGPMLQRAAVCLHQSV